MSKWEHGDPGYITIDGKRVPVIGHPKRTYRLKDVEFDGPEVIIPQWSKSPPTELGWYRVVYSNHHDVADWDGEKAWVSAFDKPVNPTLWDHRKIEFLSLPEDGDG